MIEILNWLNSDRLTSLSTFFMMLFTLGIMVTSIFALTTWKSEIRLNKSIDVIRTLNKLNHEIQLFLNNFHLWKTTPVSELNKQLTDFQTKINLIKNELKIINNNVFDDSINVLQKNIMPTYTEVIKTDEKSIAYYAEIFIDKYSSDEEFRRSIEQNIEDIKKLCILELSKFYK